MYPEEETLEQIQERSAWLQKQAAELNAEKASILEEREGLTDRKHIRQLYGDALMDRVPEDALEQRRERVAAIDARIPELDNYLAGVEREKAALHGHAEKARRMRTRRQDLAEWQQSIRAAIDAGGQVVRVRVPGEREEVSLDRALAKARDLAHHLDETAVTEVEALADETQGEAA